MNQQPKIPIHVSKMPFIVYIQHSKQIFEKYLQRALVVPIYRRLRFIYDNPEIWQKSHSITVAAAVYPRTEQYCVSQFQLNMSEMKKWESQQNKIQFESNALLRDYECKKYVEQLIKVLVLANNKLLCLGTQVTERMYEEPEKDTYFFFETLFINLGQSFFLDPFLFANNVLPGVKLQNINQIMQIIKDDILRTLDDMILLPEVLDHYEQFLRTVHMCLMEENDPHDSYDLPQPEAQSDIMDPIMAMNPEPDNIIPMMHNETSPAQDPHVLSENSKSLMLERGGLNEQLIQVENPNVSPLPHNLSLITYKNPGKSGSVINEIKKKEGEGTININISKNADESVQSAMTDPLNIARLQ